MKKEMNIYLMRHFKVDFKWNTKYNSKEFKLACENYDNSDIIPQKTSFGIENIKIYTSDLIRSQLTYKALKTKKETHRTSLINEVPIAPFINTNFRLPTFIWMVLGRIQWYLNIKKQIETKKDTYIKINKLICKLENEKRDILLIGHGFYFSQLKKVLKKNKYSGNGKNYYKNGEVIKFNKIIESTHLNQKTE